MSIPTLGLGSDMVKREFVRNRLRLDSGHKKYETALDGFEVEAVARSLHRLECNSEQPQLGRPTGSAFSSVMADSGDRPRLRKHLAR